jgi:hypothetical protein
MMRAEEGWALLVSYRRGRIQGIYDIYRRKREKKGRLRHGSLWQMPPRRIGIWWSQYELKQKEQHMDEERMMDEEGFGEEEEEEKYEEGAKEQRWGMQFRKELMRKEREDGSGGEQMEEEEESAGEEKKVDESEAMQKEVDEAEKEVVMDMKLETVRGENEDKDEIGEPARVMTLKACSASDSSEGESSRTGRKARRNRLIRRK